MLLFFDTETTGLPVRGGALQQQPRIVQLAAMLTTHAGEERACFSTLIQPAGWVIPPEAAAIHGISTERAAAEGVPLRVALHVLYAWLGASRTVVAHNIRFDWQMLRWETERAYGCVPSEDSMPARFCTMDAATPVVNLPPTARMLAAGFNRPKAPKLEECVKHFFGERLEGAHDALVDVRACARVFLHLQTLKARAA